MISLQDTYYSDLNFVSRERLDPLFSLFSHHLADAPIFYSLLQSSVLALGVFLVLVQSREVTRGRAFIGATIFLASLLFLFGFAPIYLNLLLWFPALIASMLFYERKRGLLSLLLVLLATGLWILSANALAPFGVLAAAGGVAFLRKGVAAPGDSLSTLLGVILLVAFCLACLSISAYPFPDYPGGARLTAISPFTVYGRPYIGPYFEANPQVYSEYQGYLGFFTKRFFVLSLGLGLLATLSVFERKYAGEWRRLLVFALLGLGTFLMVYGEHLLPAELGAYALFPSLARLIPGLAVLGAPWLFYGPALLFLFWIFAQIAEPKYSAVTLGMLVLGIIVFPNEKLTLGQNYFVKPAEAPVELAHSPSGYIVKTYGSWVAEPGVAQRRSFDTLQRLRHNEDFTATLSADPNPEEALLALDIDPASRWRTARPQQPGDQFQIDFAEPTEIVRVVLSVKDAPSDYPRGIRVLGVDESGTQRELLNMPDWLGSLKWTTEGFPYLGPQSEVVLDFPEQLSLTRLVFEQTGKSEVYDWSILEIKLYRFPGSVAP